MTSAPPTSGPRTGSLTTGDVARWMVTFAGFPLGSVLARVIIGSIDAPIAALVGGVINGAVLGAVQAWGLGRHRPPSAAWVAASAVGLMVGLGVGAPAVGYAVDPRSLAILGLISGVAVGIAQSVVLVRRLGAIALAWPAFLGATWALGWAITTAVGVEVGLQFTVFGSSGAIAVTVLTLVLPLVLARAERAEPRS
jgi:hypothetical protein